MITIREKVITRKFNGYGPAIKIGVEVAVDAVYFV